MFGKPRASHAVDAAAAIGAEAHDLDDARAEARLRGGLHHIAHPVVQGRNHRTVEHIGAVERHFAVEERRHFERLRKPADARAVDRRGSG